MFDLANPHSIISIHINHYFPLSTNRNHHRPIFLPHLTVSDITNRTFLIIDSVYNQSLIDWWIIDYQTGIVWFFVFIDSISFANKEYGYRFWESGINEWIVGEKESWSSSSNNSGCSIQWTNISTNDSINNQNLQYKPFQIHRIDVESQQPIFPYKAKRRLNSLHFQ